MNKIEQSILNKNTTLSADLELRLEQFNEWLIIKGYTSRTIRSFILTNSYFLKWLTTQEIELEQVSYNDVMAYVHYKKQSGNKPKTLQLMTTVLNHFFTFLVSEHQFNDNPASNIKIQGIKRRILYEILSPEELETIYKSYSAEKRIYESKKIPPQQNNELARKRNKIVLGLLIYQGLRVEELGKLEVQDIQLREGKIQIQGSKRTEGRTLKLEAHQIFDLSDYIHVIRREILQATKKESNRLFISVGTSLNYSNQTQGLIKQLKILYPKLKDMQHLRTSVITNWLKVYNLRKVQYMAGHRYISSTEAFQVNNIDELKDDISKFHPLG